jgi:xylan 1,4-beta-xylosidase
MNTFRRIAILLAWASSLHAQSSGIATYCNPIDVDYKYNFEQMNEGISYRSAADPVIINHKGEYYLFATTSGEWWHSKDLTLGFRRPRQVR